LNTSPTGGPSLLHGNAAGATSGRPEGSPRLATVARLAHVSPTTVSRVVSGRGVVSIATRKRVQEVIERCGYKPDPMARGLRLRRSSYVMVLRVDDRLSTGVADCKAEFEVIENLIDAISARGSVAVFRRVCSLDKEQLRNLAEECGARSVVLVGRTVPTAWRAALVGAATQLEIIEVDSACVSIHEVPMNARRGARTVVEHLTHVGCRNVAYLGDRHHSIGSPRFQGFCDGLGQAAGHSHILQFDSGCDLSLAESLASLLAGWRRPDGLFAATDDLGIRALAALRQLGICVPGDLKVAAMGGTVDAARCHPRLTTLAPSTAEGIDALARRLCATPDDQQSPGPLPTGSLIIRASSATKGEAPEPALNRPAAR
jgi:LacI family transcriptional regulator